MPLEDQGYCIVTARLPAGASQPRVRQLAADIDAVLKDIPGIKGWVTIGGYSALDSAKLANVVTAFVMYQDWDQRPPGFSQTQSAPRAPEKTSVHSQRASCRAAALADPRLGKRLWLPDGDRRSGRGRAQRARRKRRSKFSAPRKTARVFCASVSPPSAPTARSSTWTSTEPWPNRSGSPSTTSPRRCRPI